MASLSGRGSRWFRTGLIDEPRRSFRLGRSGARRCRCTGRVRSPAQEGEIALDLSQRPLGLMTGYRDSAERRADAGGYYHTGDVAARDDEGYITSIGVPTMSSRP